MPADEICRRRIDNIEGLFNNKWLYFLFCKLSVVVLAWIVVIRIYSSRSNCVQQVHQEHGEVLEDISESASEQLAYVCRWCQDGKNGGWIGKGEKYWGGCKYRGLTRTSQVSTFALRSFQCQMCGASRWCQEELPAVSCFFQRQAASKRTFSSVPAWETRVQTDRRRS